jgi:serine/threonine protein kinase
MSCSRCGSISHVTVDCQVVAAGSSVPWAGSGDSGDAHDTNLSLKSPTPQPLPPLDPAAFSPPPMFAHRNGTPVDPLLGLQVGSYRILKLLGTGGMGSVYLGEHSGIGSRVAIKFLHEHLASNADLVQRFYAEARAVNVIGHANIVSIFDMNVLPPNRYYLVMEYLDGQSLEEPLKRGAMAMSRAVPILSQACDALDQAHQLGVVHRDMKPENIMLVKRGRQADFAKILDFGIAKLHVNVSGRRTATGVIIGTPDYMAPEQAGGEMIDGRCDQYSLGIIAYEMATGKTPFHGLAITQMLVAHLTQEPKAPHLVNPDVPESVSMAIMKAIAKKPEARFTNCGDFATALEEAMKPYSSPSRPPSGDLPPLFKPDGSGSSRATPSMPSPPRGAQELLTPMNSPAAPPVEKLPTPAPAHVASVAPRFVTRFDVEAKLENGALKTLPCGDLSRAGCFLVSADLPRVFSRVTLTLPNVGPMQAEVVRHVTAEQAIAWNMPQGFGVQFSGVKPEQREALDRLTRGLPVAPIAPKPEVSNADDVIAEKVLGELRKRIQGDHYVVLSLGNDTDVPGVRSRGREMTSKLTELKTRPLSDGQIKQVDAALDRVRQAVEVLGTVQRRAEFDGLRFNWRGVGMCLAAGLRATEMESYRKRFLETNPGTEARVQLHMLTANGHEKDGAINDAMRVVEHALNIDPLNLELHHRRASLMKRL